MMDAPVTQEMWMAVMGENPSEFVGSERPVERVSWNDVQEFIKRLNRAVGIEGRGGIPPAHGSRVGVCRPGGDSDGVLYGEQRPEGVGGCTTWPGTCGSGHRTIQ